MKPQILAVPLLMALMLSPAFAAAATGTLTFTSPTAGSSLSGTASYTIAGTISPVPTAGTDNVNIQVTNPASQLVDVQTVAVSGTGTFSYSTNAGGSPAWTTGSYKILATDSNGAQNTLTFSYQATGTTGSSTTGYVTVEAPSLILPGQSANVFVWASNEGTVTGWYLAPGATTTTSLGTATFVKAGGLDVYAFSVALPAAAVNGVYLVGATATNVTNGLSASNIGSFTVNGGIASASALTALQTALTGSVTSSIAGIGKNVSSLSAQLTSIQTSITSINAAVAQVNTAVGSLSSQVGTIGTNVGSLQTAVGGLTTTVGSIQTAVTNLASTVNTISSTLSTQGTSISSISSSIQTLTSDVTGLQTTVSGLGNLSSQMTSLQTSVSNLSSSVSSEQTYILVVALIAAVTLVLELAILIRKMS